MTQGETDPEGDTATARSGRPDPMPARIAPMLARPGALPRGYEGWAAEVKWDGFRAAAHCRGGRAELISRNGHDLTSRFPEIADPGVAIGRRNAIVDGEIVVFDSSGVPNFGMLQRDFHSRRSPTGSDGTSGRATFIAFDLLYLDGARLISHEYRRRREALEQLAPAGPRWQIPDYFTGDLGELAAATRARGIEGLVLKRLDSRYEPGRRSGAWIKVKNVRRQEFVIGGWLPGEGARAGRIGALLVGAWERGSAETAGDDRPRLTYMGRVGTGFDSETLAMLQEELEQIQRQQTPFDRAPPPHAIHVEPALVAEIEFRERTYDGMLRHPSFVGLRPDRDPEEIVSDA